MMARETPSQTAGPYVHIGLMPNAAGIAGVYQRDLGETMLPGGSRELRGVIYDGAGAPVTDAVVEAWQADLAAFGRSAADPTTGEFRFQTNPSDDPFMTLWIVARGINVGLHTRVYWPETPPQFEGVPNARQATLIATKTKHDAYRFDIHLQGQNETLFFDI
jgi:protocatechuate 3,4-dioxygenase alpha subunit